MIDTLGENLSFETDSSKLFAIPFKAANTPSLKSEYSDAYYIISYTIMSYIHRSSHQLRVGDTNRYLKYIYSLYLQTSNKKYEFHM